MRTRPRLPAALCLTVVVAFAATYAALYAEPQQSTPPADTSPASLDELLASADKLLDAQRGFTAQPLFERALKQAIALGQEPQEAQARTGLGEVLYYRTEYAAARDHGTRALEIYERLHNDRGIGRVSHLLSTCEGFLGNATVARAHAERAIEAFGRANYPRGRALSTLQLLRLSPRETSAQQASLYERTLNDARASGDPTLEPRTLHSLGDHLFTEGNYEASLDALMRAETLFRQANALDDLGTVYNSLGRVYRAHGRFDEALKAQLAALELHKKTNVPYTLMQSHNAVAVVYQLIGDLPKAQSHYEQALAFAEKTNSPRLQDFLRANLATMLYHQGQFSRAADILEQVIAHGLDAYPARRYVSLSAVYEKLARPQDALKAASNAVDVCEGEENTCINALGQRARAYTALGNTQAALTDVNTALATLETVRARLVPNDFFKQDFHRSQEGIYSQAIGLQIHEKLERQALETAELARSRAFLDLLASRDVHLKDRDRALVESLRLAGDRTPSRIELRASASSLALDLTLRGNAIKTPVANSSAARDLELRSFATATPSAADDLVATAARLRSTLVTYWVADEGLYIWVVTPDGSIHAKQVPVLQARLRELVRQTTPFGETQGTPVSSRTIVTRGSSTVSLRADKSTAWRALYDVLIQPIKGVLPKTSGALLTIVPHGPLLNVSFAALQSPAGRYLIEDYTLHYAPAGAVLQFTAPKKRVDARTAQILVVADPLLPRLSNLDRPLPRLPGARGEAAAIARLVPASRLTLLQDAGATEARARDAAAGKAVLHFATHAIVRDDDPFASFLALGPSAGGGADGLLTSQEVYGLDLNADLVVLSACRSAGGSVTGDGISAFARAFIYAGTASLVASLWDVADEPTNRLLPDFYSSWLAGASKARALRAAQLRLLRDLRAGRVTIDTPAGVVSIPEHPVFWAGFALFGEPD